MLTVVIPTIGRDTLERSVESVRRQTVFTNFVVEPDPERSGCGPTLNRGMSRVYTAWMMGLADDDVLDPRCHELLLEQPLGDLDMVVFQMQYENGKKLPRTSHPFALALGNVGASYAIRTDVAKEIGFLDRPCTQTEVEDWEMIDNVRRLCGTERMKIVKEVMVYIRHDPYE